MTKAFLVMFVLLELIASFCFCAGVGLGSPPRPSITGRTRVHWGVAVLHHFFGPEGAANHFFYPGAVLAVAGLVCAVIGFWRHFFSEDFRRPRK